MTLDIYIYIYIYSLPGTTPKGISFEEFAGRSGNRYLLAEVSDDIAAWDKSNKKTVDFCNNVIETCNAMLSLMDPVVKKIFMTRYVEGKTIEEVAISVGYTTSGLSKRIRNECKNIVNF